MQIYDLSGATGTKRSPFRETFEPGENTFRVMGDFSGYAVIDLGNQLQPMDDPFYNYLGDDQIEIYAPIAEFAISADGNDVSVIFESGGVVVLEDYAGGGGTQGGRNFTSDILLDLSGYGADNRYGDGGYVYLNEVFENWLGQDNIFGGTNGNDDWHDLFAPAWENTVPIYSYGFAGNDEVHSSEIPGGLISGDDGDDILRNSAGETVVLGGSGSDVLNSDAANPSVAALGTGSDIYMVSLDVTTLLDYEVGRFNFSPTVDELTIIHDVGGAKDFIFVEELLPMMSSKGSNSWAWKSATALVGNTEAGLSDNPFAYDFETSISLVGGDLEFRAKFNTESAESGFIPTRETAYWWWRPTGYYDPEDGLYEFGMTDEERLAFDLKDVRTYPGFYELNSEAQAWLIDQLNGADPQHFEKVINNLASQAHALLPRTDYDATNPNFRPPTDQAAYNAALANTFFDAESYQTYPVLPFANILATSAEALPGTAYTSTGMYAFDPMFGLPDIGFIIDDFSHAEDTIEGMYLLTGKGADAYLSGVDPLEDYLFSIAGDEPSISAAFHKTVIWGEAEGYLDFVTFDRDGIATGNGADTQVLLVGDQYGYRGTEPLYWITDESGAIHFTRSSSGGARDVGFDAPWRDDKDTLLVGGAGNDILIGGNWLTGDFIPADVLFGAEGDDWFEAGGGVNYLFGGAGSDVFIIDDAMQTTTIVGGDSRASTLSELTEYGDVPIWAPVADDANDYVYVNWDRASVEFEVKDGFVRMQNWETASLVDLYDIDKILFYGSERVDLPEVIDLQALNTRREPVTLNINFSKDSTFIYAEGTDFVVLDNGLEIGRFAGATTSEVRFLNETVNVVYAADLTALGIDPEPVGTAGMDLIYGTYDGADADGKDGDDFIFGDVSDNILSGGAGDDRIDGGAGSDQIYGGDGDDWLRSGRRAFVGEAQVDYLFGGAGNDILEITGSGSTHLDGGEDIDTLLLDFIDYPEVQFKIVTDFTEGAQFAIDIDPANVPSFTTTDYFTNVENFIFKGRIDQIVFGAAGNNEITTGYGDDTFYIGNHLEATELGIQDNDTVDAGSGFDTVVYEGTAHFTTDVNDVEADYLVSYDLGNTFVTHLGTGQRDTLIGVEKLQIFDTVLGETVSEFDIDPFAGYQRVQLGAEDNIFFGGDGAEFVETGGGADSIYTGGGNDIVLVQGDTGGGTLKVRGEAGDDVIRIEESFRGDVDLSGGDGTDRIDFYASVQSTSIDPESGDLNVVLTDGSIVTLKGQLVKDDAGNWVASSEAFESYRVISTAADGTEVIDELPLSEILYGTRDSDTLGNASGTTTQRVFGFDGDDIIKTGSGEDLIDAGAGDDSVMAGDGNDVVIGGFGDDTLDGGSGDDRLEGGEGNDTFVHSTNDAFEDRGLDTIIENSGGEGDKVVLSRSLWNYSDGNDLDSVFDNRESIARIDGETGDLTLAAVNDATNQLEGIVIKDFAKLDTDGRYVNTVELYQYDGHATAFHLDPSGVVNPEAQDRYFLISNPNSTQASLTEAGVQIDESGVIRFYAGSRDGYSFSQHATDNPDYSSRLVMMGGASHDVLISQSLEDEWLIGNAGSDWFLAGGGTQAMVGGDGDDVFHVQDLAQDTTIFGDSELLGKFPSPGEAWSTTNTSYGDKVLVEWSWDESLITQIGDDAGRNAYRIEKMELVEGVWTGTGQVVSIYDVEQVLFQNKTDGVVDGSFTTKLLTDGRPIGAGDWMSSKIPDGMDIEYSKEAVSFVVNGDTLKVYADITVTETYTYEVEERYKSGRKWLTRTVTEEGTREVTYEDELVWEGPRTEVDKFVFKDGVEVNVMNIAENKFLNDPSDIDGNVDQVLIYAGTEWDDIIFGDDRDNLIDGKGGDDIIFGGGGDDVLIGGEGDDALIGGDGSDVLRGDGADQIVATKFAVVDPDYFDLEAEELGVSGNDLLVGGNHLDDIATGGGNDVVSADRLDRDTFNPDGTVLEGGGADGVADYQTINQEWTARDKLFEDDEWI